MCFVVWWWWLVWCLFGILVLFFGWLGFFGFGLVCFLFILYCYSLYIYLWNKTTGPDKGPSRGPAHEGWVLADPDPLQCDAPHLIQMNAQVMPWPSHTAAPPSIPAAEKILYYIDISTSPPPFFLLRILLVFAHGLPVGEWILHRKHTLDYNVLLCYEIWP